MDNAFLAPDAWRDIRNLHSNRKVLFVCPRFPLTYWSWRFSLRDLLGFDRNSYSPPLDLLTVAAFFPDRWSLRLVDENIQPLADEDLDWADVVVSVCNRVQMEGLGSIVERAHRKDKPVVLGGLDPSMRPHYYPSVDYLHIGLVGDATRDLILELDRCAGRPQRRRMFSVKAQVHARDYPPPRYELIRTGDYLAVSLQYAMGCPFRCEFCEVAQYYGRRSMVKRPDQVIGELEKLHGTGHRGVVVFVDDNFIGNIAAARETVAMLLQWQRDHHHPFQFFASASANLAEHPDLMDLMYDAGFFSVFVGIETPHAKDLHAISKTQNTFSSTADIVKTIHAHRLQVFGAFILGLDTEGADAGDNIFAFIEETSICTPILSLLTASQGTALYNRLLAEGRLITQGQLNPFLDSNVLYPRGQAAVFSQYVETYQRIFEPKTYFRRLKRNIRMTRVEDKRFGNSLSMKLRLRALPRMLWHMGIKPSFRWDFWKLLCWSIGHRSFNYFAYMAFIGYHYIRFSEALSASPPVAADALATTLPAGDLLADGTLKDYARAKDGPMVYAGQPIRLPESPIGATPPLPEAQAAMAVHATIDDD